MEQIIYKGIIFTNPDYDERNLNRSKTARCVKKGILKRMPCEICHDLIFEADAHHEKYSDYLNVRWLCKPHHKTIHNIFNKINGAENDEIRCRERLIKYPESEMVKFDIEYNQKELKRLRELYSLQQSKNDEK